MEHRTLIVVVLLSCYQCVLADLSQPVNSFVRGIFENPDLSSDFKGRWNASSWEQYNATRNDPNGGYLFRFPLQFEGSEDTLLFIATDRFGIVRNDSPAWFIYQRSSDGGWEKIAANRILQLGAMSIHHPSRTIIQEFPDRLDGGKTFGVLRIAKDGSIEAAEIGEGELGAELKEAVADAEGIPLAEVEKVPIAAYVRTPGTPWGKVDPALGLVAQSLDPADAEILAAIRGMEWNQAVSLVRSPIDSGDAPQPPKDDPDTRSQGAGKTGQHPETEGVGGSGWRWAVAVGIAALVIMGLVAAQRSGR